MLLTSRHLPGLALASAVTFIASVASAAPITLGRISTPPVLDTRNDSEADIDDSDSLDLALDDPPAAINLVAMDDLVVQEPLVAAEPTSLVLTGLGLALLAALAGTRWRRHGRRRRRLHWRT